MKRTTLLVAIATAAVLALAACGSTAGTPTADESGIGQTSTTQESTVSETEPADDQMARVEDTGSEDADAGDAPTTADAADAAADDTGATTAVGSGDLDAQSAAFFTTACTGLEPMGDMFAVLLGVALAGSTGGEDTSTEAPDPKEQQDMLVAALSKAGDSFTSTADQLKSLPPPTFAKGGEVAQAFVESLGSAGSLLNETATKIASASVTDQASLMAALEQLESMEDGAGEMFDDDILGQYDLDEKTQAAVEALPACKTALESFGMFGGMG